MNKLQILSIIFILVGLAGFISHPCAASPILPKAKIVEVKVTTYRFYAKYIAFEIKVCVEKDSPTPLDGFELRVGIIKPYRVIARYTDDTTLYPGQCKVCLVKTAITVDEAKKAGTLKYVILLVTKDKHKYLLDFKRGIFKVGKELSEIGKTEVEVLNIVGYTVTALMICAGLAFILGRMR